MPISPYIINFPHYHYQAEQAQACLYVVYYGGQVYSFLLISEETISHKVFLWGHDKFSTIQLKSILSFSLFLKKFYCF